MTEVSTVAYNDFRDDLILELEKRIYNNIKVTYSEDILNYKDLPEQTEQIFLKTKQSTTAFCPILNEWLGFVGNTDYTNNSYYPIGDSRTWNYSLCSKSTGVQLNGFRRAYTKNYMTQIDPTSFMGDVRLQRGTQLVGKYIWAASYTKDNLVLWKDLEEGIVRESNKKIVYKENYARSGLTGYIIRP